MARQQAHLSLSGRWTTLHLQPQLPTCMQRLCSLAVGLAATQTSSDAAAWPGTRCEQPAATGWPRPIGTSTSAPAQALKLCRASAASAAARGDFKHVVGRADCRGSRPATTRYAPAAARTRHDRRPAADSRRAATAAKRRRRRRACTAAPKQPAAREQAKAAAQAFGGGFGLASSVSGAGAFRRAASSKYIIAARWWHFACRRLCRRRREGRGREWGRAGCGCVGLEVQAGAQVRPRLCLSVRREGVAKAELERDGERGVLRAVPGAAGRQLPAQPRYATAAAQEPEHGVQARPVLWS